MKTFPIKYLYLTAAVVFILACWFSIGYKHGDEHFQIFEFAGHLLGWNSDQDMAWEFHNRMRPSFQPCLTALGISGMNSVGIIDPFFQAFLFKVLGASVLFYALYFFLKKEGLENNPTAIFFLYFFCLTPYLAARYSSEGLSASMLLMLIAQLRHAKLPKEYLLAGIFAGLSFVFRFQLAFAIVGTAIWYLIAKSFNWKEVAFYLLGFLLPFSISLLSDRFFYGEWVLAPFEYFYQNIVLNKASNYGVDPWYYYLIKMIALGLWLPGLMVLAAAVWYGIQKPKEVLTWAMLIFLIGHMLVSHKEIRFLYPIGILLPIIVLDRLALLREYKYQKVISGFLIVSNFFLLLQNVLLPASHEIRILKYLEQEYSEKTFTLYFDGQNNPYKDFGLRNNFYGRKNPVCIRQSKIDTTAITLPAVWISYQCNESGKKIGPFQLKRLFQTYPEFATDHLNFNGWVDRTNVFTVYELIPTSTVNSNEE